MSLLASLTALRTGANLLVRMVDEYDILGDNELVQATVITEGTEVIRWRKKDETIMRVCIR